MNPFELLNSPPISIPQASYIPQESPKSPIIIQQIGELTNEVSATSISFASCTLESDRWICVRQTDQVGEQTLVIFDVEKMVRGEPYALKKPIQADSAIMSPSKNILALRGLTKSSNF